MRIPLKPNKAVLSLATSCWLCACTSATKDPNIILSDSDTTESDTDTDTDQTIDTATQPDTASDTQDTDPVDTDTVDTAVVDTGESGVSGAFQGDLEIIINTQFGEDICNGTAEMDIDSDQNLTGDGTCNFGILGSQVPLFIGTVSDDGSVSGTVDLEAFGSPFTLDWIGTWNETQIECDFSASAELDSIGAIDYEIRFLIEAEEEIAVDTGDITYIDYGETGTQSTTTETGSFATSDGCTLDYTLFAPTGDSAETLVVIQHGFARSADNFADWGTHLASWGIPSVVMSLNHSSAFDVNIDQNGADVLELVESLHEGPTLYLGHSNGAVSSIVAANADDDAIAVLGLDAVERFGGDHTDDAAALTIPVYSIFGEEGLCNTWNSGLDAYQSPTDNEIVRVTEADHCDFEAPTDSTCTMTCGGSNNQFDDNEIQGTILGMTTAFLMWQVLEDEDGREWWSNSGTVRTALENDGAISSL